MFEPEPHPIPGVLAFNSLTVKEFVPVEINRRELPETVSGDSAAMDMPERRMETAVFSITMGLFEAPPRISIDEVND
jgi:hypothetical protein